MSDNEKYLNSIFIVIKNFEEMFYDEFQKCDIKRCGHCNGVGVNKHSLEFCSYCGGIGYKGFKKLNGKFICRACNASGCRICKNTGIVDWTTYITGRDLNHAQKNKIIK